MQRLRQILKRVGYFTPFTVYLLVFALILVPGFLKLRKLSKLPDSAYTDIFTLLLSTALIFCVTILCFGFVTVFVSFVYFKWKKNKGQVNLSVKTGTNDSIHNKQPVSIHIDPITLPLLGFLRTRIYYDNGNVSKKFALVSGKRKWFSFNYEGHFNWDLPEIREYHIEKMIFYFEDFFQFFSFAVEVDTSNHFYIPPVTSDLKKLNASNRKTEETTTRIEELKRVEGELINYKNFETSDDVRRIVWKIYARNKELVVRIPEILDPYASDLYIYTSFHTSINVKGSDIVEKTFLNYYKTVCWSIYQQLSHRGFEVKYFSDQPVPVKSIESKDEAVKYAISVSSWQGDTGLKDFVKTKTASVIIVSSLNELDEIAEFAESYGGDISIVYVPLSECLEQNGISDWIKWLFIENEVTSTSKTAWNISPLRIKIKMNEEKIAGVMKHAGRSVTI